jgi:hypothetical protein
MEVPPSELPLECQLVLAEDEHVDVGVFARGVSQVEIAPRSTKDASTR